MGVNTGQLVAVEERPRRVRCGGCVRRCSRSRAAFRSTSRRSSGPSGKGLKLPADLDYGRLFHGVDERVPLEGLRFGVRVMTRLWQGC